MLFNDSILYNIAYGGISDKEILSRIDSPKHEDELLELIMPSAKMS